jgi:hypothetical protein
MNKSYTKVKLMRYVSYIMAIGRAVVLARYKVIALYLVVIYDWN